MKAKMRFIIIFSITILFNNIQLIGCQCIGNGKVDLEEYILSDLIAEVEVLSFEQNDETQSSKTKVKIIKNYKPAKQKLDTLHFKSNYGGCSYAMASGKFLVWANKTNDETYSISSCSRFIRLYEKKKLKTYVSNLKKYKSERKKAIKFLKEFQKKTGYIDVIQDKKSIKGNLKKGVPIGNWEIIDNKKSFVSKYSFNKGIRDGIQISFKLNSPLAKSIVNYQNGEIHGIRQSNFVNGVPNMISTYENGKENGMKYYYHMNGKLRIRGNMVNEVLEGKWQYFRENGKIEKETIYELIKGKTPQRDLRNDNYSKREFLEFDENENLIKKTIYNFNEKVFEQEFNIIDDGVQH